MTKTIEQARRAKFEAWHRDKFKTKWTTGQPTRDMHNGMYAEKYGPMNQQQMWEAFSAALDALCISLPAISGHEYDPLACSEYREQCREAIHAAGVRTK